MGVAVPVSYDSMGAEVQARKAAIITPVAHLLIIKKRVNALIQPTGVFKYLASGGN